MAWYGVGIMIIRKLTDAERRMSMLPEKLARYHYAENGENQNPYCKVSGGWWSAYEAEFNQLVRQEDEQE